MPRAAHCSLSAPIGEAAEGMKIAATGSAPSVLITADEERAHERNIGRPDQRVCPPNLAVGTDD